MSRIRKNHSSQFKAKVALEATKNEKTTAQLSQKYSVHATQVSQWRKELLEHAHEVFEDKRSRKQNQDALHTSEELYEQIGRLKVENDFLKKKSAL